MICPKKQYNPTTFNDIRWKNCDRENCAWWDPLHHQCCIRTIAEKLGNIGDKQ